MLYNTSVRSLARHAGHPVISGAGTITQWNNRRRASPHLCRQESHNLTYLGVVQRLSKPGKADRGERRGRGRETSARAGGQNHVGVRGTEWRVRSAPISRDSGRSFPIEPDSGDVHCGEARFLLLLSATTPKCAPNISSGRRAYLLA